jgi:hypothetical protein
MSDINELAAALVQAQAEFSAVPKTSVNPFYSSRYADLASVVKAAQPVLAKHGLAVSQHPTVVDGEPSLTTYLLHSSGQSLVSTMRLCAAKHDPQGQGAAITYARRFAYQAVLGLVADDDDDGNRATAVKQAEPKRGMPAGARSPADVARTDLAAMLKAKKLDMGVVAKRFADDYGMDIREADKETVEAFHTVMRDE